MAGSGYGLIVADSGPQTAAVAFVSLVPPANVDNMGARIRLDQVVASSSGAVVSAVRLLITLTISGVRQTLGFQIPAATTEPVSLAFPKGLLGDPGTTVDITLPSLGTSIIGEVVAIGAVTSGV